MILVQLSCHQKATRARSGGALELHHKVREVRIWLIVILETQNTRTQPSSSHHKPPNLFLLLPALHTHTPHTLPCLRYSHDQPRLAVEVLLAAAEGVSLPEVDAAVEEVTQPMATSLTLL